MYKIVVEIPEGWGGYFSGQKMEILGGGGGLREIPSVVGVWIFSGTTQSPLIQDIDILLKTLRKETSKEIPFLRISMNARY